MPKLVWYISNIITLSRHGCIGFISNYDQYLDYVQCLMASESVDQMAWMATKVFATIFTRFIGVVRKTFRLRTVFLLQPLMPPSYFRNIIMTSGIDQNNALGI